MWRLAKSGGGVGRPGSCGDPDHGHHDACDRDTGGRVARERERGTVAKVAAQALSDRAVAVIRSVEARELLPRIADDPDHYLCRFCPYRVRCHRLDGGAA